MKEFYPVAVLAVSALLSSAVNADTIPEEARRHMARGMAAVEMAKSQEEYGPAMREFQEASRLAPDWPDPYYHLGLVQEMSGKYRDAVVSLKEYLRLAPDAADASKTKELIYKLEYKAEQVLTVPEIIDVLVSGFSSFATEWKYSATMMTDDRECRRSWPELEFTRDRDAVKVLRSFRYYPARQSYQTLTVTGPIVKHITTINVCDPSANEAMGNCDSVMEHEVEVKSKRLVKVNQRVIRGGSGAGVATGDRFSCTFTKE